jgi:hypothetical protein
MVQRGCLCGKASPRLLQIFRDLLEIGKELEPGFLPRLSGRAKYG